LQRGPAVCRFFAVLQETVRDEFAEEEDFKIILFNFLSQSYLTSWYNPWVLEMGTNGPCKFFDSITRLFCSRKWGGKLSSQ